MSLSAIDAPFPPFKHIFLVPVNRWRGPDLANLCLQSSKTHSCPTRGCTVGPNSFANYFQLKD